jgi:uncharacterized protein (TIGR03790 family)
MRIEQLRNFFSGFWSRLIRTLLAISFFTLALCPFASAQDGRNVLIVVNSASAASEKIAAHYARARNIPTENAVRVQTEIRDEITRAQYEREIEQPIASWLVEQSAQDRILYIVLTKGVPLRIQGSGGRAGSVASVDSELTILYRRLSGKVTAAGGPQPNPY